MVHFFCSPSKFTTRTETTLVEMVVDFFFASARYIFHTWEQLALAGLTYTLYAIISRETSQPGTALLGSTGALCGDPPRDEEARTNDIHYERSIYIYNKKA